MEEPIARLMDELVAQVMGELLPQLLEEIIGEIIPQLMEELMPRLMEGLIGPPGVSAKWRPASRRQLPPAHLTPPPASLSCPR
jgi:hypothetical protein